VLLGAIAGSFRLPIPVEAFESAIRADGKAVETNLRGFRVGLEMARQQGQPRPERAPNPFGASTLPAAEREIVAGMPDAAHAFVIEGVRRLTQYQDAAYGRLYLERLASIREADSRAAMAGKLLRETARRLALRMSFEDVIRVAQAKTDPARLARIAADKGVGPDQVMSVTEFLKPGIEEICSILPPWLARPILALSARRGWLGRTYWGMRIDSTSIGGFLRLWLLAKLRSWRPRSHRFIEEQAAIEAWLGLIHDAAAVSGDLALEVAQCARLIKGYGDTHRRGVENFRQIESRVIRPALSGRLPPRLAADAVASARAAALADPNGAALAACLAKIDGLEMRQAAQ
jgi:indolepyruvate ferredoxin oxidoreductase beta subunit